MWTGPGSSTPTSKAASTKHPDRPGPYQIAGADRGRAWVGVRNLLTNVPIVPDGTWLAKTKGLRPLVGALLAGGILAAVLLLVGAALYGAWAYRQGQGALSKGVLTSLFGAIVLGSLSGIVGFGMGVFHF